MLGRAAEVKGGLELQGTKNVLAAQGQALEKGAVELQYLEPTYAASLRQQGIVSETGEFNLKNLQALAPEQLENLRLENAKSIQALSTAKDQAPLDTEAKRRNLNMMGQQLREAKRLNDVGDTLQIYTTAGQRSKLITDMVNNRDGAGLSKLAAQGLLEPAELEQGKALIDLTNRKAGAEVDIAVGTAKGVTLDNTLKDGRIKLEGATYDYTVRTAAAGADNAGTAASQAAASLKLFEAKASSEVEIIKAQAKLIEETLAQTGKVNPLELKALRERVYDAARKNKIGDAFDEKQAQAAYDGVLAGIGLTKAQTTGVETNTAANQVSLKWLDKELEQKYNINAAQLNRIELMTPLEVAGEKAKIDRAIFELEQDKSPDTGTRATRLAGLRLSQAQLEATSFNTDRAKQLLPNELKEQGIRLDTFQQALDDARAGSADKLGILRTERATLEQTYEQNKIKFPVQMESLRKELKKADLEIEYLEKTQDTRVQVTVDQGKITAAQAEEAQDTLTSRVELFNSDADLKLKVNKAEGDLLELKEAGARGAYLKGLSDLGAPGQTIISGLVTRGVITPQQGGAFKAKAGQVEAGDTAKLALEQSQAKLVTLAAAVKDKTFNAEVTAIIANKDTALVELEAKQKALKQMDPEFAKKQEYLTAQIASVKQGTASEKALLPGKLEGQDAQTANTNANTAETLLLTPGKKETQDVQNANTRAGTANTQANTTGTLLENWVRDQTRGDKVAISRYTAVDAKTAMDSNLLTLKFADATFADKVTAVQLGNAQSSSTLKAMLQTYQQNAIKFPEEIKEIKGRIAYNDAMTGNLLVKSVAQGPSGKNEVTKQLQQLRISTTDDRRYAEKNLATLVKQFLPNAKFSIDKYDPKSFTTLVATATPEQQQQLNAAASIVDGVQIKRIAIEKALAKTIVGGTLTGKDLSAISPELAMMAEAVPSAPTTSSAILAAVKAAKPLYVNGKQGFSCAHVAGQIINTYDSSVAPSAAAKGLYDNTLRAGWQQAYKGTSVPANSTFQVGDMIVYQGVGYGSEAARKNNGGMGYHIEIVTGFDAKSGRPLTSGNSGLEPTNHTNRPVFAPAKGASMIVVRKPTVTDAGVDAPPASAKPTAAPNSTAGPAAPAAPPSSGVKGVAQIGANQIGSSYLDEPGIKKAMGFVSRAKSPPGDFKGQPARDKEFSLYKQAALSAGVKPADAEKAAEELVSGLGYKVYKVGDYRITDTDVKFLLEYKNKAQGFKTPPNLSAARQQDYKREQIAKALGTLTKTLRRNGFSGNVDGLLAASVDPAFKGLFQ